MLKADLFKPFKKSCLVNIFFSMSIDILPANVSKRSYSVFPAKVESRVPCQTESIHTPSRHVEQ